MERYQLGGGGVSASQSKNLGLVPSGALNKGGIFLTPFNILDIIHLRKSGVNLLIRYPYIYILVIRFGPKLKNILSMVGTK